ncbi:MAG: 16S rRNA (guanine(966)-N(2))-methyltransferase RsmD [Gemmatimonadota bacterium]
MTRIVAGALRGRRLVLPRDTRVRPTSDRVREAWMSIVGPHLAGAAVLDLFAGSGALGIEALSRGALHATFVDVNPPSLAAIETNLAALELGERGTVVRRDALRWLDEARPEADVAFADPPYTEDQAERLVAAFRARPFARVLGVEHRATRPVAGDDTRRYGDSAITFCYAP